MSSHSAQASRVSWCDLKVSKLCPARSSKPSGNGRGIGSGPFRMRTRSTNCCLSDRSISFSTSRAVPWKKSIQDSSNSRCNGLGSLITAPGGFPGLAGTVRCGRSGLPPFHHCTPGASPHRGQFLVDGLEIKRFRVEFLTDPLPHFLVLLVARILNGFQEVAVAPGTAAIFGGTRTAALDAPGVLHFGIGLQHFLDLDNVFPIVTEVIHVAELLDAPLDKLAQLDFAGAGHLHRAFGVFAVLLAVDLEGPQVVAFPVHDDLDDLVQLGQGAILDLDTPPDRRRNAGQG